MFWPSRLLIMYPKLTKTYLTVCHSQLAAMHNIFRAIFKTRNGKLENRNGEWGKGNGESLKRGIFKSGNLYNGESLKAVSEISVACVAGGIVLGEGDLAAEPLYQSSESWRRSRHERRSREKYRGISNASSPLLFFGSRLRRQNFNHTHKKNFNHTIPPAAQAKISAVNLIVG